MQKLKIAIVTGTRAEFGIFRPVLRAIRESKRLKLQLIVTGMHLQRKFGNTQWWIDAAGLGSQIAAKVPMYRGTELPAESLARGTAGLARALRELKPDLVMVLGDRLEILAAANAALAEQIPIAHVHGGETAPGQWDEQIRHAVTKMAHMHFCATKRAGERILQMGEQPAKVHVVGAPAIDWAVHETRQNIEIKPRTPGEFSPLLLLHPSSPDDLEEYRRAKMLMKSILLEFPNSAVTGRLTAIGPNNDPGYRGILRAYEELRDKVAMTMSVGQDLFWMALQRSGLLIGNSSSGILEAATCGCAVINVGERQAGRERNSNVIDVPWENGESGIRAAMKKARSPQFQRILAKRKNLYGDGHAAERIVRVLEAVKLPISTVKRFHDR